MDSSTLCVEILKRFIFPQNRIIRETWLSLHQRKSLLNEGVLLFLSDVLLHSVSPLWVSPSALMEIFLWVSNKSLNLNQTSSSRRHHLISAGPQISYQGPSKPAPLGPGTWLLKQTRTRAKEDLIVWAESEAQCGCQQGWIPEAWA